MARQTQYIVQTFIAGRGTELKADKPSQCKNAKKATRKTTNMASGKLGVVCLFEFGRC